MKTFSVIVGLFSVLILSDCHPSAQDKQDVREGMNFAAIHLNRGAEMSKTYDGFSRGGEFSHRSRYFKTGADYLLLKMAYQEYRSLAFGGLGDFNTGVVVPSYHENVELKRDVASQFATTSAALRQDLVAISMTPESFGKMVSDEEVSMMVASKPIPPR